MWTHFLLLSFGFCGIFAQFWTQAPLRPPVFIKADQIESPYGCPRVLNPVCAFDGLKHFKFFYNECLLRVHRCETQEDWMATHLSLCLHLLDPEVLQQCLHPCPFEFKPICATNGKRTEIFGNKCIYNMENCFASGKWSQLPEDLCVF